MQLFLFTDQSPQVFLRYDTQFSATALNPHFYFIFVQEQTISSKKLLETIETATRHAAQKVAKSLDKTISSEDILLPNKLVQEFKTKFTNLPENLADLESEIMNFNAQLSCQGTIKDDVRRKF